MLPDNLDKKSFNKAVSDLHKDWKSAQGIESPATYFMEKEKLAKRLRFLFNCDPEFNFANAKSLRVMLGLNVKLRAVAFHYFGLNIKLENIK